MLAIRRGEKEGYLLMRIQPAEDTAIKLIENLFVKGGNACSDQMKLACADSYKRLLSSSMETEARLYRIGVNVHTWAEVHNGLTSAAILDENCVAIGISNTGRTDETIQMLSAAKAAGAYHLTEAELDATERIVE